jgi:signal transduction histidine kinase
VLLVLQVTHPEEGHGLAIGIGVVVSFGLIAVRVGGMFRTIDRDSDELVDQGRMLRRPLEDLSAAEAERIRLLDRTVRATEEERARIAVELHDGPIQHLTEPRWWAAR